MLWWILLMVGSLVLLGLICGGLIYFNLNEDNYWPIVVGVVVFLLGLFAILVPTINGMQRHMTTQSCANWGVENNRATKFVSYTWWDYNCITPDGHGRWIPISQVIVNVPDRGN